MSNDKNPPMERKISRREAIRWMGAVSAAGVFPATGIFAQDPNAALQEVPPLMSEALPYKGPAKTVTDPDLLKGEIWWERTMTQEQLRATAALADAIIPADEKSPNASSVNVHEFIDEWVSAPLPQQQDHRRVVLSLLEFVDAEAAKRFDTKFADLTAAQKENICDDLANPNAAKGEYRGQAWNFNTFRMLAAGGFYITPEGWRDIGYVGNVPLAKWEGPPPEVLEHLGLE